jgi:pumilio RNA-binding family
MWSDSSAMTRNGFDSKAATHLVDNGSNRLESMEDRLGHALLIQEAMDNSGRATAPSTYWDSSGTGAGTSAAAINGRRTEPVSFESMHEHPYLSAPLADSLGLGMQRSHSAAPSFASTTGTQSPSPSPRPPPGLSRLEHGMPRPASAGLLDAASYRGANGAGGSHVNSSNNHGALRPAAKTLMDLIQEEIPHEEESSEVAGGFSRQQQYQQKPAPYYGQPPMQQVQQSSMHRSSSSPQPYPMQQPQAAFMPQPGGMDNVSYSLQNMNLKGATYAGQMVQNDRVVANSIYADQQQQLPQRYVQTGFEAAEKPRTAYSSHQGQVSMHQPQVSPMHMRPQRLQQQQVPSQPGVESQRIYLAPQQPQAQQPVEVQAPRLQAQVLPNGQTVYVHTTPQPAQGMAYTPNMQYHASAPTQASPSHQLYQRHDGQYVSVVPVHAAPSPMGFWQGDGGTGQAVMMGGSTAGLGAVQHSLLPTRDPVSPGHRHREKSGGGRNRRNDRHQGRRSDGKGQNGSAVMASPVMEEFRSNKNRQWTIAHIEGHVVEFCQDQNGSRFIQQRLEMGDLAEQAIVIREVLPSIRRLRNDVFGNYVVQKLLEFGTPQVRADIRDTLEGELMQLSLQMYGCRVVQKAIEMLTEVDMFRLLKEFHHNVLSCIYDQNGNHVIQKCIEVVSTRARKSAAQGDENHAASLKEHIEFILNDVLVNAASLSCHPYGCRVLQRILEHCDQETKQAILGEVKTSHRRLLDDQYGNYVIQHVLQFGRTSDRDSILRIVVDTGLLGLSRQKFASNVVEKLLKFGNANHRRAIAAEMLKTSTDHSVVDQNPGGTSVVLLMVRDAYANYVVQTTLDVVPESEEKRLLFLELKRHSDELVGQSHGLRHLQPLIRFEALAYLTLYLPCPQKNYTFAKHIVSKLATLTA